MAVCNASVIPQPQGAYEGVNKGVEPYFEGSKAIEEVMDLIQGRVLDLCERKLLEEIIGTEERGLAIPLDDFYVLVKT